MPRHSLIAVATVLATFPLVSAAEEVPTPESQLGYRPGADFRLTRWPAVVEYFRKVDRTSDRVVVRELGRTTEDRPYIMAIVSAPEALARLHDYQELQHRLSDPRLDGTTTPTDDPIGRSKAVVVITCSIHSSEPASTFMAMELLHELATKDDPDTREVLDKTILLLVPSANPDGIDKVAAWYERSKGQPWEGSGMPELYHKYAGHDTNRDWFMLNLVETRLLSRVLYREWFPTLLYDVHQMSARGPRLFVPPFHDPIDTNIDPRVEQGIFLVGAHMASELAAAGKSGIATQAIYDNWWNGGNRTTPQRHNIVAVLTEAASVKLATPLFIDKSELVGGQRGFPDHRPSVNFIDPWPGGWWRLRDIVDYELICAHSLLTLAARYKDRFQTNLQAMARDAVNRGSKEPPFAWAIPRDQPDPARAAEMVRILHATGIEVHRAGTTLEVGGVSIAEGSWILPAAQPYRAHIKDLMERQDYPSRFTATGAAEAPYDVSGWTLPLQMGVRTAAIDQPFAFERGALESIDPIRGTVKGAEDARVYKLQGEANDDFILINELLKIRVPVRRLLGREEKPEGTFLYEATPQARDMLNRVLPTVSSQIEGDVEDFGPNLYALGQVFEVGFPRVALYQPWNPSMDEGWTRFVLERFHFAYTTVHDSDIRAGNLNARFDALVLPSIDPRMLRSGYGPNDSEPAYTGGLGAEGATGLRSFVNSGGTLICLAKSSDYAIEQLGLPVKNAVAGLKTSEFYGPGSIVRAEVSDGSRPTAQSVRGEVSVYFDRSLAFEATDLKHAPATILRYAATNVLESGWLLGPEKIQGKAAVVDLSHGDGRVILFGFPPQNRAQTHGTFRLLFNALLSAKMSRATPLTLRNR